MIHRFRFVSKASDLKNLGQLLCCNVKYLAMDTGGY